MIPTEFIGSVERGSGDKNNPKGSPNKIANEGIWELPVWGGGLNPCPDGLGQLFLGRICLIWEGLDPCPDGLGHFFGKFAQIGRCPRVPG